MGQELMEHGNNGRSKGQSCSFDSLNSLVDKWIELYVCLHA